MGLVPHNPAGEASGGRDQSAGYARRRHPLRDCGRGFNSRRLHFCKVFEPPCACVGRFFGPPADFEFRAFLPNRARDRLIAEFESPGSAPSDGWEAGKGAVGSAFSSASLVRVEGSAVWDGTYGLTAEQQQKYRNLTAVAAMPLLNARVVPVGVLAVSTTVPDASFVVSDASVEPLLELAQAIARVLIDIVRTSRD
jgi:hypothetical protein